MHVSTATALAQEVNVNAAAGVCVSELMIRSWSDNRNEHSSVYSHACGLIGLKAIV